MKQKILIVENNPAYLKAAKSYFAGLPDVEAGFADNYEQAEAMLPNYQKALIDIFIPENKAEKVGKVGKALMKGLEASLEEERANYLVETIKENKEVHKSLLAYSKHIANVELKELDAVSLRKLVLEHPNLKESLDCLSDCDERISQLEKELANLIEEEEKGHAPLGINVAKQAGDLKIPYCFVTDGHHSHGPLYGTIRRTCLEGKVFDAGYGRKDQAEFWQTALNHLKRSS